MSNRIVIVGGGYAGAELAKKLDSKADVTLVEQRSHFAHSVGLIRALVTPDLLDNVLFPYDKLLTHGRVVQGQVTSVDGSGVTLADGTRIDADHIVLATGSDNRTPFKPKGDDIAGLRADVVRINALLQAANSVAIVGAGAVGTELAGEIAHFMPDKNVTLISSTPQLFPDFPAKLGRDLAHKLQEAGVSLKLGTRAQNLNEMTEPFGGSLTLSDGETLSADLIFPAIGSRANVALAEMLPDVAASTAGRVQADGWMRPSSLPNVFALGDLADNGDAMTVVATSRQVPWLAKTLGSVIKGQPVESVKPYMPWKSAPILVPLGPDKGSSFLSLFTVGDVLTRQIKGRDLFIKKTARLFGQA